MQVIKIGILAALWKITRFCSEDSEHQTLTTLLDIIRAALTDSIGIFPQFCLSNRKSHYDMKPTEGYQRKPQPRDTMVA